MTTPSPCQYVFVCKDCGRDAGDLRRWLKKRIKEDDRRGKLRVVRTECMGACPDDAVSVAVGGPGAPSGCWLVDPKKDREELYAAIVDADGG